MNSTEIREAWARYKEFDSLRARDELIEHYAYLVKITSGRVVSKMPPSLEREDLVSAGAMGLIKAVDNYDPKRQVKFETYAIALIRGAILEMLREDDWVPRSVRERLKALQRAYKDLEVQLGRPATESEAAAAMGMETEAFQKLLMEAGRSNLLSMEEALVSGNGNEKLNLSDVLQDENSVTSFEAEIHERKRMLGKAIERLPERERLVISLYYFD